MKIFAMVDNGGWRKMIGVLVKLVSSNKPKKKQENIIQTHILNWNYCQKLSANDHTE